MIRLSILLIVVPLALLIVWAVKKALQNGDLYDSLNEQDNLKDRLQLVKQLSPEEIVKTRAEIARIKKEIE